MNDVINKKTNRMNVDTFSAIQTVKYDLRAKRQSSISKFHRINFLRSPINTKMCKRMMLSRKAYNEKLGAIRRKRKKNSEELGTNPPKKKREYPYTHKQHT